MPQTIVNLGGCGFEQLEKVSTARAAMGTAFPFARRFAAACPAVGLEVANAAACSSFEPLGGHHLSTVRRPSDDSWRLPNHCLPAFLQALRLAGAAVLSYNESWGYASTELVKLKVGWGERRPHTAAGGCAPCLPICSLRCPKPTYFCIKAAVSHSLLAPCVQTPPNGGRRLAPYWRKGATQPEEDWEEKASRLHELVSCMPSLVRCAASILPCPHQQLSLPAPPLLG